jgi:hypothetical protein
VTIEKVHETALAPVTQGDQRRDALLRALGFDRLNEGQRELALAICQQYDLDPMLRHVVMVDGKPYITRDGLLHVAHKSGDFDGIEVDTPTLDPDGRYFRTNCRVYRKSFSRPFAYPGRYPATGGNAKYNEEMAIKVAEVMTLRRAFDVAAPVIEERWDGDFEDVPETPAPTTFKDRVAARVAIVSGSPEQPETGASASGAFVVETPETPVPARAPVEPVVEVEPEIIPAGGMSLEPDEVVEEEYAEAVEEPEPVVVSPLRQPEPEPDNLDSMQAPTDDSTALDLFKSWAGGHDKDLIRAVARQLFPTLTGFSQLGAGELGAIQREVTKAEQQRDEASVSARCDDPSPLTDSRCTMDPGHKGVHRHGTRESW